MFTPLAIAVMNEADPKAIRNLLESGSNVNEKSRDGSTPLMFAASFNYNEKVTLMLLEFGAETETVTSMSGFMTPLAMAARYNPNPEVLSALINAGAKLKGFIAAPAPVLLAARYNPNPEVISALIAAGVNLNILDSDRMTPLMLAARYNTNPDVVSVVLKATGYRRNIFGGKSILDFAKENKSVYKTKVYKELEDLAAAYR
ncbi:MAG: ankyrin repeat domain-containing protein, partial [Opitutales bacterium]|nr:ankyrin repeat domain-containing protein [Opitutales bacterium]